MNINQSDTYSLKVAAKESLSQEPGYRDYYRSQLSTSCSLFNVQDTREFRVDRCLRSDTRRAVTWQGRLCRKTRQFCGLVQIQSCEAAAKLALSDADIYWRLYDYGLRIMTVVRIMTAGLQLNTDSASDLGRTKTAKQYARK